MMEVRRHACGDVPKEEAELNSEESLPPPTTYIIEARRRIARAAVLWQRGGKHREEIIRMRCFGNYVRSAREKLDLTRAELAERTNLDPYFLLLIEGGLATPGEIEAIIGRLAEGLGKSPTELYHALECADGHESLGDDQEEAHATL